MLSEENLLSQIVNIKYLLKNFVTKLNDKYKMGISCELEETKLIKSYIMLDEITLYYENCSCLTEDNICSMISETNKLLK